MNTSITLTCDAQGVPPPTVSWKRGSELLGSGRSLTISRAQITDSSEYTCLAVNSAGSTSAAATVDVLGKI